LASALPVILGFTSIEFVKMNEAVPETFRSICGGLRW
jgi:hypothetical protein